MKSKITKKIENLIELARLEDDANTQIVLLALAGARKSGDDGMLATHIQQYLKDVLIPKIRNDREIFIFMANNN
jgi:hypothetical protein